MKKSVLAGAVLSLVASAAMARSPMPSMTAKQAFFANPDVQQAIEGVRDSGLDIADDAEEATLAGGCGFAGCDVTSIVTLTYKTRGPNTQTDSIVALVRLNRHLGEVDVKIVNSKKVLELAR